MCLLILESLLTSIVGVGRQVESPREALPGVVLESGAVPGELGRLRDIRSEDGIVEAGTGVVGNDVEVVVLGVVSACGPENDALVLVLTRLERQGRDRGSQSGEGADKLGEEHGDRR